MDPESAALILGPSIAQGMQSDPYMSTLRLLISSQNRMTDVLTKFLGTEGGFNSLASSIGYLAAQTGLAQMFGIENPLRVESAYRAMVEQFYPARSGLEPYLMYKMHNYVSKYNTATDALNTRDPWTMKPYRQTELIAQLSRSNVLSLDEMQQLGDSKSDAYSKVRSAEEASILADKFLGISDIASALNMINVMGGTSNIKENSRMFKEYISTLVSEGLSMGEMMQSVQDNLKLNKSLRLRGFSVPMAAALANQSAMVDIAYEQASKLGISFDKVGAKNSLVSILADYSVGRGYEKQVAYIAADRIEDAAQRESYLKELDAAGNDLNKIEQIQDKYGIREYARDLRSYQNSNRSNLYGSAEVMSRAQMSALREERDNAEQILRNDWKRHSLGEDQIAELEYILSKIRSGMGLTRDEANMFRNFSGPNAFGFLASVANQEKMQEAAKNFKDILTKSMANINNDFGSSAWAIMTKDNWENMIDTLGQNNTPVETMKFQSKKDFVQSYMKNENVSEQDAAKVYDSLFASYQENNNFAAALTGGKSGNMYRMTAEGIEAIAGSDIAAYEKRKAEESTPWFKPLIDELSSLINSIGGGGAGSIQENVQNIATDINYIANNTRSAQSDKSR